MATRLLLTAEEFRDVPSSEGEFELVRGEVVEMNRPNFTHAVVCKNAAFLLETSVRSSGGGFVLTNDVGVITERDPDSVRGPDVAWIASERAPRETARRGWLTTPPDLVVEVQSPSDRWSELIAKSSEYLAAGVREVWIVDPDERRVHRLSSDRPPRQLGPGEELAGEPILPGFRCDVAEFFLGL